MSSAVVRPFEETDRGAVIALWEEVFADDPPWNAPAGVIDTKATVQPELFLVALVDDELAGTALAGFDGMRGWLHHIATAPAYRGRGIAEQLIRAGEAGLRDLGCRKVNLQVRAGNDTAARYYQRLGYAVEERISLGKLLD